MATHQRDASSGASRAGTGGSPSRESIGSPSRVDSRPRFGRGRPRDGPPAVEERGPSVRPGNRRARGANRLSDLQPWPQDPPVVAVCAPATESRHGAGSILSSAPPSSSVSRCRSPSGPWRTPSLRVSDGPTRGRRDRTPVAHERRPVVAVRQDDVAVRLPGTNQCGADTDPGVSYVAPIQNMQPGPAPSPIGISRMTSSVFKSTTATRSAALSPR